MRRLSGPPYTLIRCVRSWGAMQIVYHKTCTVIPKGGSITVQKAVAEVTTCKLNGLLPGLPDDRERMTNNAQSVAKTELLQTPVWQRSFRIVNPRPRARTSALADVRSSHSRHDDHAPVTPGDPRLFLTALFSNRPDHPGSDEIAFLAGISRLSLS